MASSQHYTQNNMPYLSAIEAHTNNVNTTLSFVNSMSLRCAVELGIPDALQRHAGGPLTLNELAAEVNIPPERTTYLARLMRKLEHLGLFAKQPNADGVNGYTLTPSSLRLCGASGAFVRLITGPAYMAATNQLGSWIRGDHGDAPTPFHAVHGVGFWEYAGRTPEFNDLFNRAMTQDAELVVGEVVAKCGSILDGVRTLVDVGGGNGAICRAIAEAYGHVSCSVLDLPHVVEGLLETERVKYVGGNMFELVPPADVAFMKHILHDYGDEDCVKILKQCKKSIAPKDMGGKVIIVDIVINIVKDQDFKLIENQLFYDYEMMAVLAGKERYEHEWREIFDQAGFTSYKITPIMDFLCLIEVFP